MTDYGRYDAGTPSGGNQSMSVNFGLGTVITIPNGVTITQYKFYANTASPTTKYRVYAYLKSGAMTGTGANLIDAPEVTGVTLGLNTVNLVTTYTNSSGSSKDIYFGHNIIVAAIDMYLWGSSGNLEQPYFGNGGSDVPPASAPAFNSNLGAHAHFVTGASPTVYDFPLGVATFAVAAQSLTRAISKAMGGAAFTVDASSGGTGKLAFLVKRTVFPAIPTLDPALPPTLIKARVADPKLTEEREP